MDSDTTYRAWLAALARSNHAAAREHARVLLYALQNGDGEPEWSASARVSFDAWCRAEGLR